MTFQNLPQINFTYENIHKWYLSNIQHMDFLSSYFYDAEPTMWENFCSCWNAWIAWLLPLAGTIYWYIFFTLMVLATAGRKLKLRRFYIEVLNRLFYVAAAKMEQEITKEKMRRRLSFMEEYEDSDDDSDVDEISEKASDPFSNYSNKRDKLNYMNYLDNEALNRTNTYDDSKNRSRSLGSSWEQLNSMIDDKTEHLESEYTPVEELTCCCQKNQDVNPQPNNAEKNISLLQADNADENASKLQANDSWEKASKLQADNADENASKLRANDSWEKASKLQQPTRTSPFTNPSSGGLDSSPQDECRPCCCSASEQKIARFPLDAPMLYISAGLRAILDDCVSNSFSREQLKTWNLLSRTIQHKERIRNNKSLAVFFLCGLFMRYVILMPMRVLVLILSLTNLTCWTFLVGCLPNGPLKRTINSYVVSWGFDFVAGSLSVVARFHDKENRPHNGIAVANHTSPIDGMVLATDNCYDMVGQKTKGLLGMFMNALAKSSGHIWFERGEARDRQATTRLLFEHTQCQELPPILIFPEGVCVNNTAVLEFRKGAFEVDCNIYPVAVRFDPVYGDAFWYEGGFASYCFSMMTSWAIVCDVFYLPPMRKGPDESASVFASRVRSVIAQKVGLVELEWNSMVKMAGFDAEKWRRLKEERQMEKQRQFARSLSLNELRRHPSQ